jgi:hypothetical protein
VSPVNYEMGFYIPEDDILHSHCRGNFRSYAKKCESRVWTQLLVYKSVTAFVCCHSSK